LYWFVTFCDQLMSTMLQKVFCVAYLRNGFDHFGSRNPKKSIEKQQQSQLSGCKQVVESVPRDRRQCLMNSQTGHLGDKSVRTVKLEKNIEIPSLTPTITNYSTT
jgi:hypothetical protein